MCYKNVPNVVGFESEQASLNSCGIQAADNHPGKARMIRELRAEKTLSPFPVAARAENHPDSQRPGKLLLVALGRGFTLTELLVVISVIAVLMALLFPVVKSARRSSNTTKSVAQLKQTGVFLANYAGENNNCLPLSIDWGKFWQGSGSWFQGSLASYAKLSIDWSKTQPLPDLFYDPTLTRAREHPWGSFGVNSSILLDDGGCMQKFGHKNGISVLMISNAAQKVIYCSASAGSNPKWDSSWGFVGETFVQKGMDPSIERPDPRQSGGAVSLFVDGHVQVLDVANMDKATRRRHFTLDPDP